MRTNGKDVSGEAGRPGQQGLASQVLETAKVCLRGGGVPYRLRQKDCCEPKDSLTTQPDFSTKQEKLLESVNWADQVQELLC